MLVDHRKNKLHAVLVGLSYVKISSSITFKKMPTLPGDISRDVRDNVDELVFNVLDDIIININIALRELLFKI